MYGSRAVTPLVLISDNVINRILKLDIQTNILLYVTRCCTDLTSKVLKEWTFGQSSAELLMALKYGLAVVSVVFCHFHKCVLVHIRIKGEVDAVKLASALQ